MGGGGVHDGPFWLGAIYLSLVGTPGILCMGSLVLIPWCTDRKEVRVHTNSLVYQPDKGVAHTLSLVYRLEKGMLRTNSAVYSHRLCSPIDRRTVLYTQTATSKKSGPP